LSAVFYLKFNYNIDKLGSDKINGIGEKCSEFGFWHNLLLLVFLVVLGGLLVLLKFLLLMVWFQEDSRDDQTKAPQTRDFPGAGNNSRPNLSGNSSLPN
jgi:hypothetical protein